MYNLIVTIKKRALNPNMAVFNHILVSNVFIKK